MPIPTWPVELIIKAVVLARADDEVETANSGRLEREEVAETENIAKGVVVPMPRVPRKLEAVVEVEVTEEGFRCVE